MKQGRAWQAAVFSVLIAAPFAAGAQIVDFAQLDASRDTQSVVLVKALRQNNTQRPDPLVSATYTRWDTGSTASLGYMHRWALTQGTHSWLVGAGVGANAFRSRTAGQDDENALSLRAQTELSGPAPGGRYYGLLQASTFRDQIFGLVQYDLANSPLGFELSRLRESEHRQTVGAVRYALDSRKHWFLRGGLVKTPDDTQPFIGFAYNGF
jgi:hypothetical protein